MSDIATHIAAFFSGFTVAMLYATWDLRKLRRELSEQGQGTTMVFRQCTVPDGWTKVAPKTQQQETE